MEQSQNRQIERTLTENPAFFMYFNNGITAITKHPPRKINATAKQISLTGLQIINGAQTVYSIYQAYKNAKNGDKNFINGSAYARFVLKLDVSNEANTFVSRNKDKLGLYETIFNKNTTF